MKKLYIAAIALTGIAAIASCGESGTNNTSSDAPAATTTETASSREEALYKQNCMACHGGDGTAGLANAANLQTSRMDSLAIINVLVNGKNSMPSFKTQLTEEQRGLVASYIIGLRK